MPDIQLVTHEEFENYKTSSDSSYSALEQANNENSDKLQRLHNYGDTNITLSADTDFIWTASNSQAAVTGYTRTNYVGSDTEVVIPYEHDGDPVTAISNEAFKDNRGITCVTIPKSITTIGASAFSGCTSLTQIIIPDSVESIGTNAFSGCSGFTIICAQGSTAEIHAIDNNIPYMYDVVELSSAMRFTQNNNNISDAPAGTIQLVGGTLIESYETTIPITDPTEPSETVPDEDSPVVN